MGVQEMQRTGAVLFLLATAMAEWLDDPLMPPPPPAPPPLPPGHELVQLAMLVRHGDRSPLTPTLSREFWRTKLPRLEELRRIARGTRVVRFDRAVDTAADVTHRGEGAEEGEDEEQREGEKPGGAGQGVRREGGNGARFAHSAVGDGVFGTLTQLGLAQMERLGQALRAELIEGAIPDEQQPAALIRAAGQQEAGRRPERPRRSRALLSAQPVASELALYSTDFPRTIQSLQVRLALPYPTLPTLALTIQSLQVRLALALPYPTNPSPHHPVPAGTPSPSPTLPYQP
jgi:hypothetical protein